VHVDVATIMPYGLADHTWGLLEREMEMQGTIGRWRIDSRGQILNVIVKKVLSRLVYKSSPLRRRYTALPRSSNTN
jgi:hypothetical protein